MDAYITFRPISKPKEQYCFVTEFGDSPDRRKLRRDAISREFIRPIYLSCMYKNWATVKYPATSVIFKYFLLYMIFFKSKDKQY